VVKWNSPARITVLPARLRSLTVTVALMFWLVPSAAQSAREMDTEKGAVLAADALPDHAKAPIAVAVATRAAIFGVELLETLTGTSICVSRRDAMLYPGVGMRAAEFIKTIWLASHSGIHI
jgi:hypothetical protein